MSLGILARLVHAFGSLCFVVAIARALSAEAVTEWGVVSSAIGLAIVSLGFPFRLGVFKFQPTFDDAGNAPVFESALLRGQLVVAVLGSVALIPLNVSGPSATIIALTMLTFVSRTLFELSADLLRAKEKSSAARSLVVLYGSRSIILLLGSIFFELRTHLDSLLWPMVAMLVSCVVPSVIGLHFLGWRNIRQPVTMRDLPIRRYFTYTLFLVIPYLADAALLALERTIYAGNLPTARAAEYFIWSDLARFYFTLLGVLFSFDILPEALRIQTGPAEKKRHVRRLRLNIIALTAASLIGFLALIIVHSYRPGLIQGTKPAQASPIEMAALLTATMLWATRMNVLSIVFQAKGAVIAHSLFSILTLVAFGIAVLTAIAYQWIEQSFYFLLLLANFLSFGLSVLLAVNLMRKPSGTAT